MQSDRYGILGKHNKLSAYDYYFKTLLSKLDNIFIWENLPNTIDSSFLNSNLFLLGYSGFFEIGGKIYTNFGGIGGKPNSQYQPTLFTLANPVLGSKQFKINMPDADCIIMYNTESDKQFINMFNSGGLYRLIKQTATLLADNLQSINMAQINSRVQSVFTASDDKQARTAEEIIKRMYNGEPYQILISDELNPMTVQNLESSTGETISNLLQIHQYILADFYNQIGIPTTPYQKKERLITSEIDTLDTVNNCNIYTMLNARQTACAAINETFNTNISIDIAPWLKQPESTNKTDNKGGEPIDK